MTEIPTDSDEQLLSMIDDEMAVGIANTEPAHSEIVFEEHAPATKQQKEIRDADHCRVAR